MTTHHHYMAYALELAQRGRLSVSPNPMVGCVLVKNGVMIGEGYHQRAGGPHAEIFALNTAGEAAHGATAYVTLEPCCHQGRTPACTEALIKAGISRVYVAVTDPNPQVAGKGIKALQAAGIEVITDVAVPAAAELNEIFFHYMKYKKPFVIAKWAMSLDGKTITNHDDTRNISGSQAELNTHELRQQVDAILVGANTVRHDNPQLTARYTENIVKQPLRIILSSQGILPAHLHIFKQTQAKTLLVTSSAIETAQYDFYRQAQIDVLILPSNAEKQVDLSILLNELGQRGITSLLVEGGMTVLESFFAAKLVNKTHVYIAPVIIGKNKTKQWLPHGTVKKLGNDIHFISRYEELIHV